MKLVSATGVRCISLQPRLSRSALANLKGARPTEADFDTLISTPTDAYDPEDGRLVFRFRKQVLPASALELARDVFGGIDRRMKPSFRRKTAAGRVDLALVQRARPDVVALEHIGPSGFTAYFVLETGKKLRDPMSNPVLSFMAGYNYDRYNARGVATGFTAKFPREWKTSVPFFESIGASFEATMPDAAKHMHEWCRKNGVSPTFTIGNTCLSTVAINVNYDSRYHFDQGDLPTGYSTLTAMAVGGTYQGGYLVLPKYRVAIDIRDGDLLCNQSHLDLHGNTVVVPEKPDAKRLSFVTYLKRLLQYTKSSAASKIDVGDE